MWRLAVSCLLSDKVREQNLVVVNELGLERPKAKEVLQLLQSLGVSSSSLLVTRGRDLVLAKSANNLERVKVVGLHQVRIQDLTKFDTVVITADALRGAEEAWARKGPKGKRGQVVQV
jgi:large subunit ribosomal protein L4